MTALTTTQLRDIYAGRLTNWKQLGGRDLPIRMVSRVGRDSGSRRTFREKVLAGDQELGISSDDCKTTDDPVARHHRCEVGTTEELLTRVNGIDGAIGYAELGASRKYPAMSVMSLDGVIADTARVADRPYKFREVATTPTPTRLPNRRRCSRRSSTIWVRRRPGRSWRATG